MHSCGHSTSKGHRTDVDAMSLLGIDISATSLGRHGDISICLIYSISAADAKELTLEFARTR